MDEEIDTHRRNKTWKLIPRLVEGPVIDNKWIYRIKTDGARNTVRFKSRLVVRGFRQCEGVDYGDTFSPVARYNSVLLLLAIAAAKNFELRQFDVSTAFLFGDIDDIHGAVRRLHRQGASGTRLSTTARYLWTETEACSVQ